MYFNIAIFLCICIEIYKTFYPNEYITILKIAEHDLNRLKTYLEPKCLILGYNIIYLYSCGEIFFIKFIKPYIIIMSKCIKYFLKKYNIIHCNKCDELVLEFFNQGKLVTTLNFDKNNKEINIDKVPLNYDFIVCADSSESKSIITNKICVSNIHHYIEYDFNFENTIFSFMSLQLLYKDNNYTIELKNDNHNFYIVNNVLDKQFFRYYLKYFLNLDNVDDDFSYKIELLDQDVNLVLLTDEDKIIINKQDYTIVNNKDIK